MVDAINNILDQGFACLVDNMGVIDAEYLFDKGLPSIYLKILL